MVFGDGVFSRFILQVFNKSLSPLDVTRHTVSLYGRQIVNTTKTFSETLVASLA